jgi:hypothetical protein
VDRDAGEGWCSRCVLKRLAALTRAREIRRRVREQYRIAPAAVRE